MFFGHMRRPISRSWNGLPFTVMPGTNQHNLLDLKAEESRRQPMASCYGVILAGDGTVVTHTNYLPSAESDSAKLSSASETSKENGVLVD